MFSARLSLRRVNNLAQRFISTSERNLAGKSTGEGTKEKKSAKKTASKPSATPQKVVKATPPATPIFDNTSYKVPEYYGHNEMTFFDLDVEMAGSRLPQPSSVKSTS